MLIFFIILHINSFSLILYMADNKQVVKGIDFDTCFYHALVLIGVLKSTFELAIFFFF